MTTTPAAPPPVPPTSDRGAPMKLRGLWSAEPAVLIGAFRAILVAAVGFGLNLSAEQVASIVLALEAVLTLLTRASVFSPAAVGQIQADNATKVIEAASSVVVTDAPIVLAETLNAVTDVLDPEAGQR